MCHVGTEALTQKKSGAQPMVGERRLSIIVSAVGMQVQQFEGWRAGGLGLGCG